MNDVDFDKYLHFLESFMAAPTWKAVVVLIGLALICVLIITKYFYDKNKREAEAWKEDQRIRKEQKEILLTTQKKSKLALVASMDTAFRVLYERIVERIKTDQTELIYFLMRDEFHVEITEILMSIELTPEEKSAQIIKVIRT